MQEPGELPEESQEKMTKKKAPGEGKGKAVLDPDYTLPVLNPRSKRQAKEEFEQVDCPTCEGTGRRGNRACPLCKRSKLGPGRIWAAK